MMLKKKTQHSNVAVIYCRVSSVHQTTRGSGLASQESRCREFAKYRGYEILEVFTDDMSGSLMNRPGMKAMLSMLNTYRSDGLVVLIEDVSRLARDLSTHLQLRASITAAGGKLESPSIEFGEDSDSLLVENMLASVSQHQRQKNAEQTKNRMHARVSNGYWTFWPPRGFKYQHQSGRGKVLTRAEPLASFVQTALEGFASGRFQTQVEVKRYLEAQPVYPKDKPNGEIHSQRIYELLTQPLYAGMIQMPSWDISLRPAQHEGLISYRTYEKIQKRLKEGAKAPARKDLNTDFPLRGFVACGDCGAPLTSSWSRSHTGKEHPYYLCFKKGCSSYRKSIRRDKLESEFESLLLQLQPTDKLIKVARLMFEELWKARIAKASERKRSMHNEIRKIESQVDQLLDRIVQADTPSVVAAYEKRISKLERDKLLLEDSVATMGRPKHTPAELFELAIQFLSSPWKIWEKGKFEERRMVLKLAFCKRISYHRERGFTNPEFSLPFRVLGGNSGDFNAIKKMAHPRGFEPLTSAFGAGSLPYPNYAIGHARVR